MVQFKSKCQIALEQPPPVQPDLKIIQVVAAALVNDKNEILVTQRPAGKDMEGLWEFPGGKIENGEIPEYALMRELKEELGIEVRPCCMLPVAYASHSYTRKHILMPLYMIRVWAGEPKSIEGQAMQWLKAQDLYALAMPEADRPLLHQLEAAL
jgi:8-oxo-dGTP diphosphatase